MLWQAAIGLGGVAVGRDAATGVGPAARRRAGLRVGRVTMSGQGPRYKRKYLPFPLPPIPPCTTGVIPPIRQY